MPSQRPFFLATFFAAFRQQPPSALASASATSTAAQPNKHSTQTSAASSSYGSSASPPRSISSSAQAGSVIGQLPLHSPRSHHHHQQQHHSSGPPAGVGMGVAPGGIPIPPGGSHAARRRGSDSSSEGFREVLGADKLYIGGRTAAGEEKFFKLGVVRRVRSGDRLSLDRLSL